MSFFILDSTFKYVCVGQFLTLQPVFPLSIPRTSIKAILNGVLGAYHAENTIDHSTTRRGQGGDTCCRFLDFLSEGRASYFSDKILRSNFGPNFFRQFSNNFSWFIIWVRKIPTKIGHFSNKTKNGQIWLPKFEGWKVIDIC